MFHDKDVKIPKKWELLNHDPNIFLIRDFLTPKDLMHLDKICSAHSNSFNDSFVENENNQEVKSTYRTSKYIHVSKGQDSTIRSIEQRVADVLSSHQKYIEPLQIVSYCKGQYFETHHDAGTLSDEADSVEMVRPVRLVTLFVYLNNLPEGQGHTEFPILNLSLRPQRGCGLLFCNLLPTGAIDVRTQHRACPVEKPLVKYGMNVWLTDCDMQALTLCKSSTGVASNMILDTSNSELSKAERFTREYLDAELSASKKKLDLKHKEVAAGRRRSRSKDRILLSGPQTSTTSKSKKKEKREIAEGRAMEESKISDSEFGYSCGINEKTEVGSVSARIESPSRLISTLRNGGVVTVTLRIENGIFTI